jgi:hypothetical protein
MQGHSDIVFWWQLLYYCFNGPGVFPMADIAEGTGRGKNKVTI